MFIIRQRFESLEEYRHFIFDNFIQYTQTTHGKWTKEEYEKLKPFFDYEEENRGGYNYPKELKPLVDYYLQLSSNKNRRFVQSSNYFTDDLLQIFGFASSWQEVDLTEEDFANDIDEVEEEVEITRDSFTEFILDVEFPIHVTAFLEKGFDRVGKFEINLVDIYSVSDPNYGIRDDEDDY